MAFVEVQKVDLLQSAERATEFFLAPIYQELSQFPIASPDFSTGAEAITRPSQENKGIFLEMAQYLRDRFKELPDKEAKLRYLGMVPFDGGPMIQGTDTATEDHRMGRRYNESPRRDGVVNYPFHLSNTVVPNILYEVAVADLGGYQVRTNQSPDDLSPAVNANQANATTMIGWLSQISGLELRLPTENEYDFAVSEISGGMEYIYGDDEPDKNKAKVFDPQDYRTEQIDVIRTPNGRGINMGGNVWEMTTPNLETDFKRIPSDNGALVEGYMYMARGGGFQHCKLGPRRGPRMACDPLLRSPSIGFRMAISTETRDENPEGGWVRKTEPMAGTVLYKESGYHESSIQFVQSKDTAGLSILNNGHLINVDASVICEPKPPARSIQLASPGESVYQTEHILATLSGLNIWNVRIIIDGGNAPPAGDHSSLEYAKKIQAAGLYPGTSGAVMILDEIKLERDGSTCVITPGKPSFDVRIDFPNPFIGVQTASFSPVEQDFITEIAPARTFRETVVTEEEWEHQTKHRLHGLPPFSKISEAPLLVATEAGWQTPLRFKNEPARHKLLDVMGDLALLGLPIAGNVHVEKPGHSFNRHIVKELHAMIINGDPRIMYASSR